jgi:hypothetical protein
MIIATTTISYGFQKLTRLIFNLFLFFNGDNSKSPSRLPTESKSRWYLQDISKIDPDTAEEEVELAQRIKK